MEKQQTSLDLIKNTDRRQKHTHTNKGRRKKQVNAKPS